MTDFLKSLAARSLGIAKKVQPRLGPRFGPEPKLGPERPIRGLEPRSPALAESTGGESRGKDHDAR
ncbi:MAG: hypothetical protein GY719_24025 [bacterium]|nr:hypothetical protein [bacterium]